MGYDQVRAAKIEQCLFQDFPCRNVQMVRRFVQDEEIRAFEK